jgi:hypothetical protein
MRAAFVALPLLLALAGCNRPAAPDGTTGLSGVVLRGPTSPVCRVDVPCAAPFSASFTAEQSGRPVAAFHSDGDGRFTVALAPGDYTVIPSADAPIRSPQSQAKAVQVRPSGFTAVQLEFDTGIR